MQYVCRKPSKIAVRNFVRSFFVVVCVLSSAACVDTSDIATPAASSTPSTTSSSSPTTTTTSTSTVSYGFSGATAATNLDGARIQITWNAATGPTVTSYQIFELLSTGLVSWVGGVASSRTSFIVSGLAAGSFHTYVVQAFDDSGNGDGNLHTVAAMTYAGITGATNLGNAEATLTFSSGGISVATQYNAYCSTGGGAMVAMGSVSSSASTINLTGLSTNTLYACQIKAVSPVGTEDANTATYTFTTRAYQGVILVKAYGDAPTAPAGQPTARQVSLTWNAFLNAAGNSLYKLVRVQKGQAVTMTTSTACAFGVTSSCVVCQPFGVGNKTCTDLNVDNSQQYDYLLSMAPTGTSSSSNAWLLPVVDTPYRISVQIPPANMALVHRDSVNVEECWTMGRTTDPLNHQRCAYSGMGAVPYNSGAGLSGSQSGYLNLNPNYFDMGYNFFVDRWEAGCNWTAGTDCGGG